MAYTLSLLPFICISSAFAYEFQTKYIDVPLDHYTFATNRTFKLRYLVNDSYYDDGPIFFYTGNEGDIHMFADNTGFIFDIAPQFNALIVFAEHRYYGTSLPAGNDTQKFQYLSTQQALADFVYLIYDLQTAYSKNGVQIPVVTFGGSYGGMLSAWLRMKYPHSVIGAIAASAPIWNFYDLTPCGNFYRITTDVYTNLGSERCSGAIKKSWSIIRNLTKTSEGKDELSKLWNLCAPLKTDEDVQSLIDWAMNIYVDIAMVNYPYSNSFLYPVPANPVQEFCQRVNTTDDGDVLKVIGHAIAIYTNYTGQVPCNNISAQSDQLGDAAWNYQACSEMIMPICSTNDDMFETAAWDFKEFAEGCYKDEGVKPTSEVLALLEYGGRDIKTASNIVFSNGLLDPWSSAGVLSNISATVVAVVIPDSAHHLDLRKSNPNDPESVINARKFHISQITKWLAEFDAVNKIVIPSVEQL